MVGFVGFEKVAKRRVPFGVQCKYAKFSNATLLKILPASGKLGFILVPKPRPARSLS
jgi:hypothetical protein